MKIRENIYIVKRASIFIIHELYFFLAKLMLIWREDRFLRAYLHLLCRTVNVRDSDAFAVHGQRWLQISLLSRIIIIALRY